MHPNLAKPCRLFIAAWLFMATCVIGCAGDEIIMLEPLVVTGTIRSEIVGFTVTPVRPKTARGAPRAEQFAFVWSVYPNTAAERAGLAPADRIVRIDGEAVDRLSPGEVGQRLRGIQRNVESGRRTAVALVVERGAAREMHELKLSYPAESPRWGIEPWQPPPNRQPALIRAEGLMAQVARTVLENGVRAQAVFHMTGEKVNIRGQLGRVLRHTNGQSPSSYKWQTRNADGYHCVMVVQHAAGNDIILTNSRGFIGLISVEGKPREAWFTNQPYRSGMLPNGGLDPVNLAESGKLFEAEINVWTDRLQSHSRLWPL